MATRSATPLHLWIVGALALLWNGFGSYDYMMTRLRNADYAREMMPGVDPQAMFAWVDAFPLWAQSGWALGVWGGLLGAGLLLARHRWAVAALAVSFAGAVAGLGYQIVAAPPLAGTEGTTNSVMPFVIILIALGLFVYARTIRVRGVLR